jgi:hypothetical protein
MAPIHLPQVNHPAYAPAKRLTEVRCVGAAVVVQIGGDAGIRAYRTEYNGTGFTQNLADEENAVVRMTTHDA